jgi:hypothetical protein
MRLLRARTLAALAALAGLAGAAPADEPGPIRDDAGLFKPETVQRAARQIAEDTQKFHCGLFVRTIKALPAEDRKGFRFLWTRQINRRLTEEVRQRAEEAGVNGVYLEICEDPRYGYVKVVVWPPAKERVFTASDCENLRKHVARKLREGKPDEALLDAVGLVRWSLAENLADLPTVPTSESFLGGVLAALVVAWVLLLGVRRRLRPASPVPTDLAAAGWQTCLGLPAGAWLADRVFLAHQAAPPAPAAEPPPEPAAGAPSAEEASVESLP